VAAFNWNPARLPLESVAALRWNTQACERTALSRRAKVFAPQIPLFDTQANWETDMISKSFKLPKGQLDLSAALFTASMIAMWSGTAWIFVFVLLR
jgi:hypothetical protein